MNRHIRWFFLLLTAVLSAGSCFTGSGDDDDDTDSGGGIDCNPNACEAIAGPADCQAIADDAEKALACTFCLKGTLTDAQVAQCILDHESKGDAETLRDRCKELVAEQCRLGLIDDDTE